VHRTTFVRQAANLWALKEHLWCFFRNTLLRYDPTVAIVDSLPCQCVALPAPRAVCASVA
jgi:hypothetical protein